MSKTLQTLVSEQKGKTAVFSFGRFNPPTVGHELLIKKIESEAKKRGADFFVYPSHSQDPKKNPLTHDQKINFMKLMFPKFRSNIIKSDVKNAIDVAVSLYKTGEYKNLVMVVGSDRVENFKNLLEKYNGVEAKHGVYKFDTIQVVSAGERDPDADDVTGMSASKMRAAAKENDYETFRKGIPSSLSDSDTKKLYDAIRKGMKINEEFEALEEELLTEDMGDFWTIYEELDDYQKDQMLYVVESAEELNEILSPAMRRKLAQNMKRLAKSGGFKAKVKRAREKVADTKRLMKRARKAAIKAVVAKLMPKTKDTPTSELSYSERDKISKLVKSKASAIAKMASRLVRQKRKDEMQRRKQKNQDDVDTTD